MTGRSCGPCDLCCTVLRVDELRKLGGVPCAQLRDREAGGGCGIHPTRPPICRAYRCLWLQGKLADDERPDRLGAVLDLVSEGGAPLLLVRETEPAASRRDPRLVAIIERYRAGLSVRVSDARDVMDPDAAFTLLLPGGEEHRVRGDERTVLRPGAPAETHRLPALDRLVRRLVVRWRRLRLRGYGAGTARGPEG